MAILFMTPWQTTRHKPLPQTRGLLLRSFSDRSNHYTLPPTDSSSFSQESARLSMSLLAQVCDIRDEGFKLNQNKTSGFCSEVDTVSISNLSKSGPSEDVTEGSGFDLPSTNSLPLNLTREAPGTPDIRRS